jgi:serine/threonine-protein kinase
VSGAGAARLSRGEFIDGKYEVVDLASESESYFVYRAEHRGIQRLVDVKMLAPQLAPGGPAGAALLRESRAAGSVAHRNVQSVVDSGLDEAGRPFVVYEALQGQTVAALIEGHPQGLPRERAAALVLDLLEGLRAMHRGGVVHRGLSPETVWVLPVRGGGELVKIGGLGDAALVAEARAPMLSLEALASSCAAPELSEMIGEPDPRTDVYAVGALLRLLLVGLRGASVVLDEAANAVVARATEHAPPLRFADAEELQRAVAALLPTPPRVVRDEQPTPVDPLVADLQYLQLRRTTWHAVESVPRGEARIELYPMLLAIEGTWRVLGPSGWPALVERVPEVEALLPGSAGVERHLEGGVPVPLASRILAAADALGGRGDLGFIAYLGDVIAQRGLRRLVDALPEPLTPSVAASVLGELWPSITRQGRVKSVDRGPRRARILVQDQVQPSLELCALVAGLLRGTLRESGASRIAVNTAACQALGDPVCSFALTWDEPSPGR